MTRILLEEDCYVCFRIWYFTADDTFFDTKNLPAPCKFGYINYVPEGKNDNMANMLQRLNEDLKKKPVAGELIWRGGGISRAIKYDSNSTVQCNTTQHNAMQHNTINYDKIQHNAIQCNVVQCNVT